MSKKKKKEITDAVELRKERRKKVRRREDLPVDEVLQDDDRIMDVRDPDDDDAGFMWGQLIPDEDDE